jgi:hypothetical protein
VKKVLLAAFLLLAMASISSAQPGIQFNEIRHDFGKVGQDDKIEYFFEFSNVGNQPLVILKLTPS